MAPGPAHKESPQVRQELKYRTPKRRAAAAKYGVSLRSGARHEFTSDLQRRSAKDQGLKGQGKSNYRQDRHVHTYVFVCASANHILSIDRSNLFTE